MGKFKLDSIKGFENIKKDIEQDAEKVKVGAGLLSDVSKGILKINTVMIPRENIKKNPKNKYSIDGIKSLAESIRAIGLAQPLHVTRLQDGNYMLLGGERRLTAIDMLIDDPEATDFNDEMAIPCIVKGIDNVDLELSDENKERFLIITTNKEARKYTDADTYAEIQDWKLIIDELRANGIEALTGYDKDGNEKEIQIKGEKTRDVLSDVTGISRGQINKFEKIEKNATDELKDALMQNLISVSVAEKAVSELSDDEQKELAAASKEQRIVATDVKKFKVNVQEGQTLISQKQFKKDIKEAQNIIKNTEIILDETELEKYHFYIEQLVKLLRGHS